MNQDEEPLPGDPLPAALRLPKIAALVEAASVLRNQDRCGCDGPPCSYCSDNGVALDTALAAILRALAAKGE